MSLTINKVYKYSLPMTELVTAFIRDIQTDYKESTITIATSAEVRDYMMSNFPTFKYVFYSFKDDEVIENTDLIDRVSELWSSYLDQMKTNIDRVYLAYQTEYEPLDNYNRMSVTTTTKEGTETNTNIKDGSISNSIGQIKDTTIGSTSPEDDNNFFNTEKSESTTDARNDSTTYNNVTDTMTLSYDDRTDTIEEHTHGNIGVTTSMQMLNQEVQGRNLRYIKWLCDDFVHEYFSCY